MYFDISTERRSLCCTIMKDWVGALSTIPREHPGVNNLVLAYTCSLYICIFIYRLSAVRCTIILVWAGLLSTNYMLCVPYDSMISLLPTSHLPTPTPHLPCSTAHSVLFVVLYVYEGLGRGFAHHTQRASRGEHSCTCLYM